LENNFQTLQAKQYVILKKYIYILIVQNRNTLGKGKKGTFPEFIDNNGTPPVVICCMQGNLSLHG
jgi:hypothetical protein